MADGMDNFCQWLFQSASAYATMHGAVVRKASVFKHSARIAILCSWHLTCISSCRDGVKRGNRVVGLRWLRLGKEQGYA